MSHQGLGRVGSKVVQLYFNCEWNEQSFFFIRSVIGRDRMYGSWHWWKCYEEGKRCFSQAPKSCFSFWCIHPLLSSSPSFEWFKWSLLFSFFFFMLQVTGIQCQHHQLFQRQGLEEPHPPLDPHQHLQFLCGHLQHQPPPWGSSIFLCEFRLQLCSMLLPQLPRLCEWWEREGGGGGMVMLSSWALPLVVWDAPPSGPRLCKWWEAKRRSDVFFFFCGSHFKLCVTLLLQLPGCANDGERRKSDGFFFLSVSASFICVASPSQVVQMMGDEERWCHFLWVPPSVVWHLPPRLCKQGEK